MHTKSRSRPRWPSIALGIMGLLGPVHAFGQQAAAPAAPQAPPARVTLDDAIDLALKHNHSLQAARTTILQNQAQEITANLRPNPTVLGDSQFLPFFQPNEFNGTYLDNSAQFDVGLSYLFERGKKRQHRLQAAKDATTWQRAVDDNARTLTFNVASQFISALLAQSELDLADKDLASFQQTVDIGQASFNAGSMSGSDLLKIKIQLLQFLMDVSAAKLARVQALASLRQLLGYESVAENYEVVGDLEYKPVKVGEDELKAMALRQRPDVHAAQLGITAAQSQLALAKADGKVDVTGQANYTHVADVSTASLFASVPLPVFNRNQGEIARDGLRHHAVARKSFRSEQASIALTDVHQLLRRAADGRRNRRALPIRLPERGRGFAGHQPVRVPARRHRPARFPGRRAELSRHRACLPASISNLHDLARTIAPGSGNQEFAMTMKYKDRDPRRSTRRASIFCSALAAAFALAGCGGAGENANKMTSFSTTESAASRAELFSLPADQLAHIQIYTVVTAPLERTLRLTGAVAYNGFLTTPVITQVGGPVSRIVVAPGEHVKAGDPMLYVTSPDYSVTRSTYIKARDAFQLADRFYKRAQDLFAHQAIAQADLEQAESNRAQAEADLQSSEQAIRVLGIPNPESVLTAAPSAELPLLAPLAGEVVERLCSPGELLQAGGTQCFTLSDMNSVWVLVNVYQNDIAYVHVGQEVTIDNESYPGVVRGKIQLCSA